MTMAIPPHGLILMLNQRDLFIATHIKIKIKVYIFKNLFGFIYLMEIIR